jgi:hypothetical protein
VSKSFEYATGAGDEINDSESYLIKLSLISSPAPVAYSNDFDTYGNPDNEYLAVEEGCISNEDQRDCRSNARLQDFSNSYVSHPFVTEKKSPYEGMLAKNTDSFFNVNNYKHSLISNFSQNSSL